MSFLYSHTKRSSILLPILVAIAMIAYFIALIYALNYFFPLPVPSAVRYAVMPVAFAFPWILFVYIFRERTMNASDIMNRKGNLIPLRWRMLYGFNTLIIIAFFIFPFISPPLAIFAALVLAYRIVHHSEKMWEKTQGARLGYTLILFIFLAVIPIYLTIIWFQYFITYVAFFILTIWIMNFDLMYFTSLCIVNALSVGALLALSYGTLDERGKLQYAENRKMWLIYFTQLVLIITQWILFNPFYQFYNIWGFTLATPDPIGFAGTLGNISYINYICLAIIGIVYIVKFAVGIGGELKLSIIGVLFAAAFLIVEILSSLLILSGTYLRPGLIIGSSLLFVIAFTISFFAAPDELIERDELITEEIDRLDELATEESEISTEEEEN